MQGASSDARIEAALEARLPSGASAAVWPRSHVEVPELGPREAGAVRRAVPRRRAEFARGRHCAREALHRAGWSGGFVEIPVGDARQPLWPDGFTGSITHCDGLVAAVAAPVQPHVVSLGLDAEVARPLPEEVRAQVLTPEERTLGGAVTPTLVFSAKEAIHKALFPVTGIWLDFLDVTLSLDQEQSAFSAARAPDASMSTPLTERLRGRYRIGDGLVLALAWLPDAGTGT
ncbi:MAG: 4'-phosphopantetheinyl transferase superfamily protein [Gemmatimonadota bacterium]|nr:4'-phosphopantetheinyl transferase superfamily protein [Gemmatimonadota bacterium]